MAKHDIRIVVDTTDGSFSYQGLDKDKKDKRRLKAKRKDDIEWSTEGSPFVIQFQTTTPAESYQYHSNGTHKATAKLRDDADYCVHKYAVGVFAAGKVFIDDPEVLIEP